MARCTQTTNENLFSDHFFSIKEAQKRFRSSAAPLHWWELAFPKNFGYVWCCDDRGGSFFLIYILQNFKQNERYTGEPEHNFRQECQRCKDRKKSYACFWKGGAAPHKSLVRLKALAPKAAIQLHEKCIFLFKNKTNFSIGLLRSKPSVSCDGSGEERYNHQNWTGTFVVKVPSNGKVYVAITSHKFKEYRCGWIGFVHHLYLLQSRKIGEPFQRFRTAIILKFLTDSDKREYLERPNASDWRENSFDEETILNPFMRN